MASAVCMRLESLGCWPTLSGAHGGEESSAHMWKALTYFVALTGVGVSMFNVFLKSRHKEHLPPSLHQDQALPGEMVTIPCSTTLM